MIIGQLSASGNIIGKSKSWTYSGYRSYSWHGSWARSGSWSWSRSGYNCYCRHSQSWSKNI